MLTSLSYSAWTVAFGGILATLLAFAHSAFDGTRCRGPAYTTVEIRCFAGGLLAAVAGSVVGALA